MLWVKALHIISVVCWFAVLFYLPRLFVYHAMADNDTLREQFKIMERRLYFGIGVPASIATLVFGVWTVFYAWEYYFSSTWFWIKMVLVLVLIGYHHACGYYVKQFSRDNVSRTHVFFRWFNELPTILLVVIVFLVVLKRPF